MTAAEDYLLLTAALRALREALDSGALEPERLNPLQQAQVAKARSALLQAMGAAGNLGVHLVEQR